MKIFESTATGSAVPTLFQIAAFFEDLFPAPGSPPAAISHLPIAEYQADPEKIIALLQAGNETRTANSTASAKVAALKRRDRPAAKIRTK